MTRGIIALLALLSLALVLAPTSTRADEPAEGVWIYDVRVVRVETTTSEVPETAGAWEPKSGTTLDTAWPELLKALKERGRTVLLMDQRITALAGREVRVQQSQDRQIEQFQNRDLGNERWQSSTVSTGCTVKLMTAAALEYHVDVKWELAPAERDLRALLGTTQWQGEHPLLGGRTLVLRHRQQVDYEGRDRFGHEIYVFVTGRLAKP